MLLSSLKKIPETQKCRELCKIDPLGPWTVKKKERKKKLYFCEYFIELTQAMLKSKMDFGNYFNSTQQL